MTNAIHTDERTQVIENASYRWGFLLLCFGILMSVAWRGLRGEAAWDLLALVTLAGGFCTAYQSSHQILSRRWGYQVAFVSVVAIVIAVAAAWLTK